MKRFAALMIAAVMTLGMAACSESEAGKDISIVTQKVESEPDTIIDIDQGERLTPATTIMEDLRKSEWSDFEYLAKCEINDDAYAAIHYYDGSIKDDAYKAKIFEVLCRIFKGKEIVPKGKQQVQGGDSAVITLRTISGAEYSLCEGILVDSPELEGGSSVYVLKCPENQVYFLDKTYRETQDLKELIAEGIRTADNYVKTKQYSVCGPDIANPEPDDIACIYVYTNYAEGQVVKGSYIHKSGRLHEFDFSESFDPVQGNWEQALLEQICVHCIQSEPNRYVDAQLLTTALDYAEKIDPSAEVTEEHMMCDAGQRTVYAVVGGKLVMLGSTGDNDKTVEDENAQKAMKCFEAALRSDSPER